MEITILNDSLKYILWKFFDINNPNFKFDDVVPDDIHPTSNMLNTKLRNLIIEVLSNTITKHHIYEQNSGTYSIKK